MHMCVCVHVCALSTSELKGIMTIKIKTYTISPMIAQIMMMLKGIGRILCPSWLPMPENAVSII